MVDVSVLSSLFLFHPLYPLLVFYNIGARNTNAEDKFRIERPLSSLVSFILSGG